MEYNGICPWCGGDRLYWNDRKNCYICFSSKCNRRGKGKPPVETWLRVGKDTTEVEVTGLHHTTGGLLVTLPEGSEPLDLKGKSMISLRILDYLKRHHIDPRQAKSYGLLQTHESLVAVLYNRDGALCFYQERFMFGNKGFRNPAIGRSTKMFFTHRRPKKLVLVESIMNAIRMAPLAPAAAFLGSPVRGHYKRLRQASEKWLREVLVVMDADAQHKNVEVLRHLMEYVRVRIGYLPFGDVCDMDDVQVRRVFDEAGFSLKD